MLVWKTWTKVKHAAAGYLRYKKHYKMLLLFGFIPLYVSVDKEK